MLGRLRIMEQASSDEEDGWGRKSDRGDDQDEGEAEEDRHQHSRHTQDDAPDEQHEETEQEEEEGAGPAGANLAAFGEGGGAGEGGEGFVEEPSLEHMSVIGLWKIENLIIFCALTYHLVGGGNAGEGIRQPAGQVQRQQRLDKETRFNNEARLRGGHDPRIGPPLAIYYQHHQAN